MAEQKISKQDGAERRASGRFRIEQEIRYRMLDRKNGNRCGSGRTLDMSSGGVLFTADESLPVGKRVELAVDWPARLDGRCALKFVATGPVVRTQAGAAAIAIERYEFRTKGSGLMSEVGRE
jgi:c-di-GMP-binding flagellar brake protein YcgR